MSPEQATDAKNVDHRSDIYSLGVVLYEFATRGHLPYIHLAEREAALSAIRSERIESKWPRDHVPDFPRGLERIILKATAHRPEERYQEMSELIGDLDRYARGEWLPWFTRIHPRRQLRHLVQTHPRLAWGVPAAVLLLLLVWAGFAVPELLDKNRRHYEAELAAYALVVDEIESGRQQQLSAEQRQRFAKLTTNLTADSKRYPEQVERLAELDAVRRAHRYLKVKFTGIGDDDVAAMKRLELAADAAGANWRVVGDGGLMTGEHTTLKHLKPYGGGQVVVLLEVELRRPDGFLLAVTEADEPRSRTSVAIENGTLRLTFDQDEVPSELIHQQPFRPGATLYVYLIIDDAGVRAWIPQRLRPTRAVALTPGSPAHVRLELPAQSVLRTLEIWPEKAASGQGGG